MPKVRLISTAYRFVLSSSFQIIPFHNTPLRYQKTDSFALFPSSLSGRFPITSAAPDKIVRGYVGFSFALYFASGLRRNILLRQNPRNPFLRSPAGKPACRQAGTGRSRMEVEGIAPSSKRFTLKGSPCSVRVLFNRARSHEQDFTRLAV